MIDGYTQAGASANTLAVGNDATLLIELSGAAAPTGVNGLVLADARSTIRGLVINRFQSDIIGGGGRGVVVDGNLLDFGLPRCVLEGNFIGTDAAGSVAAGNGGPGVEIVQSSSSVIGGSTPDARNVISGNGFGVTIAGEQAVRNEVLGNFIGTDRTGLVDLGNRFDGVGVGFAFKNVIGGTTAAARNVISGHDRHGITFHSEAAGNQVQGNYTAPSRRARR